MSVRAYSREACNKCYEDIINDGNCSSLFSLECMKMKIKYIVAKCRKMTACLKLLHDIIQWKWNKATRWKTLLLFMSFNYDNNKPTKNLYFSFSLLYFVFWVLNFLFHIFRSAWATHNYLQRMIRERMRDNFIPRKPHTKNIFIAIRSGNF